MIASLAETRRVKARIAEKRSLLLKSVADLEASAKRLDEKADEIAAETAAMQKACPHPQAYWKHGEKCPDCDGIVP